MKHYKKKLINGKLKSVHRLIMEKHLRRKLQPNEIVHHVDENIHNNKLTNLRLMTRSTHIQHHGNGRYLSGEAIEKIRQANIGKKHSKRTIQKQIEIGRKTRSNAKLTPEDIPVIREMLKDNIPYYIIAFVYGIDKRTVSGIKCKTNWAWVA